LEKQFGVVLDLCLFVLPERLAVDQNLDNFFLLKFARIVRVKQQKDGFSLSI
jgi:hypothetical protein